MEANISTVSQAINYQEAHVSSWPLLLHLLNLHLVQEERFVGTAVGKEVDSGPQRQEDLAYQTAK